MDLPSCPACGQSVLDDDAVTCPFCGSSMSGKPAKKSPLARAPASKPSAAAPSSAKAPTAGAGRPTSGGAKPPQSKRADETDADNPIAADQGAAQRAIPLSRRPEKGRSHGVVCPMCETEGYTSTKAAGKEVRCANPDCLVPLFTAPSLETDEAPPPAPEPEKAGMSKGLLAGVGAILLLAAAGGGYYVFLMPHPDPVTTTSTDVIAMMREEAEAKALQEKLAGEKTTKFGDNGGDKTQPAPTNGTAPPKVSLDQIQSQALEQIVSTSLKTAGNRSKPFCRRLAAEAFAIGGDVTGAREQLVQMGTLRDTLPYFQVLPLTKIGWQQLKAGDMEGVAATADEAYKSAAQLPKVGRYALDASTALAALLIVAGRQNEARALLDEHRDNGPLGQLSALLATADAWQTYDVEAEASRGPLLGWSSPQWAAVVIILTAHGQQEQALEWARSASDVRVRDDGLAAWAEGIARSTAQSGQPDQTARIDSLIADAPAVSRARIFARIAAVQAVAGNQAAAESALALAHDALQKAAVPAELKMPSMRELAQDSPAKPPEDVPLQMAAQAAGEIARVEAVLGRQEEAWKLVTRALAFARAIGPSATAAQKPLDEIDRKGANAVTNEVKQVLELSGDQLAAQAFNRYRRQLGLFRAAADTRLQVQVSLLKQAAEWNLREQVAAEVASSADGGEADRDPFLKTELPYVLAAALRTAGAEEQAKLLESKAAPRPEQPFRDVLAQTAAALAAEGKLKEAAAAIEQLKPDQAGSVEWQLEWMFRLGSRLVRAGQPEKAFELIGRFESQIAREDGYNMTAALATRHDHGAVALAAARKAALSPTESVSAYRGVVTGLAALRELGKSADVAFGGRE